MNAPRAVAGKERAICHEGAASGRPITGERREATPALHIPDIQRLVEGTRNGAHPIGS